MPEQDPDRPESFEQWLRRQVAAAVEAGEVSARLLREVDAELDPSQGFAGGLGPVARIRWIAERTAAAPATAEAPEANREGGREQALREIAQSWLEERRKAYRKHRNTRKGLD